MSFRPWLIGLTGLALTSIAAGPAPVREAPLNPTDHDYLLRQYAWFQSLDAETQQRYRRLHADFQALPPEDSERMTRVLQRYQAWMARRTPEERKAIADAPSSAARLQVVKDLRDAEWVATLPAPYRADYAQLDQEGRRAKVREWRREESDRRDEWEVARQNWSDFLPGVLPKVLQNDGLVMVDKFVENLRPALNEDERRRLDTARSTAYEQGVYVWYAMAVATLAEAHPLVPGKVGPTNYAQLPQPVQDLLVKQDRLFRRNKNGVIVATGKEGKEVERALGRWPDFAVELTKYCRAHNLEGLPPLGDCTEETMPQEIKDALKVLRSRKGDRATLDAIEKAKGKWPDYPKLILDASRKSAMTVPGWTLPGQPAVWEKLRTSRKTR